MSNPYAPGPLAGAGESLVGALLGGDAVREKARQGEQMRLLQQQSAEATIDKKITDAYLARDKRQAQQGMQAAYEAADVDPVRAAVMANANIAGFGNLEQAQRYDLRAQVPGAMEADGVTHGNALVMALANKLNPAVSNVAGQNVAGLYGDAPVIGNSDETLSKILANKARAGASNASAGASNARTRYTDMRTAAGAWNPNTGKGKPVKPVDPITGAAKEAAPPGGPTNLRWIEDGVESVVPLGTQAVRSVVANTHPKGNEPSPLATPAPRSKRQAVANVGGRNVTVIDVANPNEARAAFAELLPGQGIRTPGGKVMVKK